MMLSTILLIVVLLGLIGLNIWHDIRLSNAEKKLKGKEWDNAGEVKRQEFEGLRNIVNKLRRK